MIKKLFHSACLFVLTNLLVVQILADDKDKSKTVSGAPPEFIPSVTEWGMIILSLLLVGSALYLIFKRQRHTSLS